MIFCKGFDFLILCAFLYGFLNVFVCLYTGSLLYEYINCNSICVGYLCSCFNCSIKGTLNRVDEFLMGTLCMCVCGLLWLLSEPGLNM